MQQALIGRSAGANVRFAVITQIIQPVTVAFCPTLFGATFVVAADSELAAELASGGPAEAEFNDYLEQVKQSSDIDRMATDRPKTGVFLHRYAINPVNGEQPPVHASDHVLADYGTGAVMAVPAHDQRDSGFREGHLTRRYASWLLQTMIPR